MHDVLDLGEIGSRKIVPQLTERGPRPNHSGPNRYTITH